jgi:hypothetical protein
MATADIGNLVLYPAESWNGGKGWKVGRLL